MDTWLPSVSHLFPGITPFNVWDITLHYWLIYVGAVKARQDELKRMRDEAEARRRQRG